MPFKIHKVLKIIPTWQFKYKQICAYIQKDFGCPLKKQLAIRYELVFLLV